MNKKLLALSTLALSLTMGPIHYANAQKPMNCFAEGRIEHMVAELGLSADQKSKIKAIHEQAKTAMMAKGEEMVAMRHKMNEMFKSGKIDDSALESMVSQQKETFGELIKLKTMERRDISNVLTEAQRVKLATMMEQWEAKMDAKNKD